MFKQWSVDQVMKTILVSSKLHNVCPSDSNRTIFLMRKPDLRMNWFLKVRENCLNITFTRCPWLTLNQRRYMDGWRSEWSLPFYPRVGASINFTEGTQAIAIRLYELTEHGHSSQFIDIGSSSDVCSNQSLHIDRDIGVTLEIRYLN